MRVGPWREPGTGSHRGFQALHSLHVGRRKVFPEGPRVGPGGVWVLGLSPRTFQGMAHRPREKHGRLAVTTSTQCWGRQPCNHGGVRPCDSWPGRRARCCRRTVFQAPGNQGAETPPPQGTRTRAPGSPRGWSRLTGLVCGVGGGKGGVRLVRQAPLPCEGSVNKRLLQGRRLGGAEVGRCHAGRWWPRRGAPERGSSGHMTECGARHTGPGPPEGPARLSGPEGRTVTTGPEGGPGDGGERVVTADVGEGWRRELAPRKTPELE